MRRLAQIAVAATVMTACRTGGAGGAGATGGGVAAKNATPAEVTPSAVAMGDSIFNNGSCQRCHGQKGVGAPNGPALNDATWAQLATGSYAEIEALIISGVAKEKIKGNHPNAMQPRGGRMNLTDPQIKAVAAYVWTLSQKS